MWVGGWVGGTTIWTGNENSSSFQTMRQELCSVEYYFQWLDMTKFSTPTNFIITSKCQVYDSFLG